MKSLYICLFVFYFLFLLRGEAQQKSFEISNPGLFQEQIFIHHNSSIYFPGERLYYSLYNLNQATGKQSEISKIASVLLINSEGKPVFSHILDLKEGVSYSDFLIPPSISTGSYILVGYTNWMNNYENNGIFKTEIFILNPYLQKTIPDSYVLSPHLEPSETNKYSTGNSSVINLDKENYNIREKVSLNLEISNSELKTGKLSISIRKTDSFSNHKPGKAINLKRSTSSNFNFKNFPEYRGKVIKGYLIDSTGKPVFQKKSLVYTVKNRPEKIRFFSTDKAGAFDIQISDIIDYDTARLKVITNEDNYQIKWDSLRMDLLNEQNFRKTKLNLNEDILKRRIIHHQIEQYYSSVKSDSIMAYSNNEIFYGDSGTSYVLDDYTRFNTMQETFVEIINFVSFKLRNNKTRIQIADGSGSSINSGTPMVLVDGNLIENHQLIYDMNPRLVESIRVIIDKYNIGPAFFQGILDIRTKNQNFPNDLNGRVIKLKQIEKPKVYYSPNYSERSKNDLARIPDYRYQLLWIPHLKSNEIEFFTSDIYGEFEIRIEGFLESGKPVSIIEHFHVTDQM